MTQQVQTRKPSAKASSGYIPSYALLRKLDNMELEPEPHGNTGQSRWMIPYADLITLLLGLFMVMFSLSRVDSQALDAYSSDLKTSLSENQLLGSASDKQAVLAEPVALVAAQPEPQAELPPSDDAVLQSEVSQALNLQSGVHVSVEERGVVISLEDSILFPPGNAELTPQARQTLDKLSASLKTIHRPIRVEGHTDDTPIATSQFPSNWELSTARATNILKYLVTAHGLSPKQLSAAGYGEFRPLGENSSIEGKQKNRRVDIVILSESSVQHEPAGLSKAKEKRE